MKNKSNKKTIQLDTLIRLSLCNSPKIPKLINRGGRRKRWVGIGWLDEGPATGREVKVI